MTPRGNHRLLLALLFALTAAPACGGSAESKPASDDPGIYLGLPSGIAPPWSVLPYDSIQLERSVCFGSCPSYLVQFFRGEASDTPGLAVYVGESNVPRQGSYEGTIDPLAYARLCQLFERAGFEQLEPAYGQGIVDLQQVTLTVRRPSSAHSVRDVGGQAPPKFRELVLEVDAIADALEWAR